MGDVEMELLVKGVGLIAGAIGLAVVGYMWGGERGFARGYDEGREAGWLEGNREARSRITRLMDESMGDSGEAAR